MSLKNYFANRGFGFYLSLAEAVVALVFAVVYQCFYGGTAEYSAVCFVVALVMVVATVALTLTGLDNFVGVAQLLCSLAVTGAFLYANYYYISVVIVGIDASSFSARFVFASVACALLTVASIVNMFAPASAHAREEVADNAACNNEINAEVAE